MFAAADRNLVFGALALKSELITREQLVAGVEAWTAAPHKSLAEVLEDSRFLSSADRMRVEHLVAEQFARESHTPIASTIDLRHSADEATSIGSDPQQTLTTDLSPGLQPIAAALPRTIGQPRFEIIRFHAQGGLGRVFVARDRELGREVALKEIRPERAHDPLSQSRFIREAEITGGLEHPGIVPVYALGAYEDGRPYYAMRFIPGSSLQDEITAYHAAPARSAERNLQLRRLLQRLIDVCKAVEYAHRRGVLHRDLKPANVMVGDFGEALVVDWGLAKLLRSASPTLEKSAAPIAPRTSNSQVMDATGDDHVIGSPAFMCPEQARGENSTLGPAADVFSLGAILYAILTGRPPYAGSQRDVVLELARRGDYRDPRSVNAATPLPLNSICCRALAAEPGDRFVTARQMAEDLEKYLADEPASAHRESWSERLSRLGRRHRAWVRALAATLVAASLAAVTAAILVDQARRAEIAAKEQAVKRSEQIGRDADLLAAVFDSLNPRRTFAQYGRGDPSPPDQQSRVAALLEAAHRIQRQDIADPLIAARLQNVIGSSLVDLGETQHALPLLEQAAATRQRLLGRDNPDTLVSLNNVAAALKLAGDAKQAIDLLTDVLARTRGAFGESHAETIQSMNNLAAALLDDDQIERGIQLLREAQALVDRLPGGIDADLLTVQNNLGVAYLEQGRPADAIPVLEELRSLRRTIQGEDHFERLETEANLAAAYYLVGRVMDALNLLEPAAAALRRTVGEDHPTTLDCEINLAECYKAVNRRPDAITLLEGVVEHSRNSPARGPRHPQTLLAMNNLGAAYIAAKDPQASPLLEECLHLREEVLGTTDSDTLVTVFNLAGAYATSGRANEAIPLYQRALAAYADDHPQTNVLQANLAQAYMQSGRTGDAVVLLEKVLARRAGQDPESVPSQTARANMGRACLAAGQPERGIELLREFADIHRKTAPDLPFASTLFQIANDLLQHKQFAAAEEFARRSHELLEQQPASGLALKVQLLLGEALTRQAKFTEAQTLLLAAHDAIQERPADQTEGPQAADAIRRLIMLYEARDMPAEAERWKARLPSASPQSPRP